MNAAPRWIAACLMALGLPGLGAAACNAEDIAAGRCRVFVRPADARLIDDKSRAAVLAGKLRENALQLQLANHLPDVRRFFELGPVTMSRSPEVDEAASFPAHWLLLKRDGGAQHCAATAISPTALLTAAHCVEPTLAYAARLGSATAELKCTRHQGFDARCNDGTVTQLRCGADVAVCTLVDSSRSFGHTVALARAVAAASDARPRPPFVARATLGCESWDPAWMTTVRFAALAQDYPGPYFTADTRDTQQVVCRHDSGSGAFPKKESACLAAMINADSPAYGALAGFVALRDPPVRDWITQQTQVKDCSP